MTKIACDPHAAHEAMKTIWERHEALGCHLWGAIKAGIETHDRHELAHGFNAATPAEVKRALAATILDVIGSDEVGDFADLLLMVGSEEFLEIL